MNSFNNHNCHEEHEHRDCDKKPCPTIVKCGTPGSATIPAATAANTVFTLNSLTLNTECLKNPTIKLEFASNLLLAAFAGTISFRVTKLCRGQLTPVPVGPAWTFTSPAVTAATTFSFFVCDCDSCFDECCTYTVTATVIGAATAGVLTINNATLGAIATCGNGCCS